jgi:hypothetical protein
MVTPTISSPEIASQAENQFASPMGTGNVANKYAKVSSAMACTNWCTELFSSGRTPRMTISAGMLATIAAIGSCQEHAARVDCAQGMLFKGHGWLTLNRDYAHPMTLTPKIFFVCKDFQGVYAATAVSWAVTGVSWATVERNALRMATMILRPLEVSW